MGRRAFRRRVDEAVGGNIDNVGPLLHKSVDRRGKFKMEAPPPGQCTFKDFKKIFYIKRYI